ncbi:hypothetical protein [Rosistilla oblonga]|uniref:hypothetical protein n=1 Tax=Rosistilla oblonga TaxID=2527990 RepID=UPI003A97FF04
METNINPYASDATKAAGVTDPSRGWEIAGRLAVLAVTASYLWNAIRVCFDSEALRQNLVLVVLLVTLGVFGLFVMAMPLNRSRHLRFLHVWGCLSILLALYLAIPPIVVHAWLLMLWNISLLVGSMFSVYAFRKAFYSVDNHERGMPDGG